MLPEFERLALARPCTGPGGCGVPAGKFCTISTGRLHSNIKKLIRRPLFHRCRTEDLLIYDQFSRPAQPFPPKPLHAQAIEART